jgi:hypothetical protein
LEACTGLNIQLENFTLNLLGPTGGKPAEQQELEELLEADLDRLDDEELELCRMPLTEGLC